MRKREGRRQGRRRRQPEHVGDDCIAEAPPSPSRPRRAARGPAGAEGRDGEGLREPLAHALPAGRLAPTARHLHGRVEGVRSAHPIDHPHELRDDGVGVAARPGRRAEGDVYQRKPPLFRHSLAALRPRDVFISRAPRCALPFFLFSSAAGTHNPSLSLSLTTHHPPPSLRLWRWSTSRYSPSSSCRKSSRTASSSPASPPTYATRGASWISSSSA